MRKAILFAIVCALSYTAHAANINISSNSSGAQGLFQDVEEKQDQPSDPKKDDKGKNKIFNEDGENGNDNDNGNDDDSGPDQGGGKKPDQDHGGDPDQDEGKDMSKFMRVDCRYHNVEKHRGVNHCYASAIYIPGDKKYGHVRLGVGCDQQTIYNDAGRVHIEQVGERISPPTAAFPGVEIFPQGALSNVGTYESVLDVRAGRMIGTCYVHRLGGWNHDYSSMNWLY